MGHYCPEGTAASITNPCPAGTFAPNLQTEREVDCTDCTPGSYCETTGLDAPTGECNGGYYCLGAAISATPFDHLVRNNINVMCFCSNLIRLRYIIEVDISPSLILIMCLNSNIL